MRPKFINARDKLMEQGKRHIMESGFNSFSVPSLTAECGMGTGTFYGYFKSKNDLIMEIMEADWNAIINDIDSFVTPENSSYDNLRYIYERISHFESSYGFSALDASAKSALVLEYEKRSLKSICSKIAEGFERQIAMGRMSMELPPETAAYYIVQLCAMTGMNPDTSFDDLWKFMHIKGI